MLERNRDFAPVDLDAYCARIGYTGPRTPTLATLRALHALHPAAIPFEAFDVLLGRGIDLRPEAIDAKLIGARRGGYCHEQNGLFKRVLITIGFEVESLMARVQLNVPPGARPPPRSHVALRVTIDGEPWLADVGFGGCVALAPLRLATSEPQATALETYRIVPAGDDVALALRTDAGEWLPMYSLLRAPQIDADFEMMNWYTATHPDSQFRRLLMVARVTPAGRCTLRGNRFTVRGPGAAVERRLLDIEEIEAALADVFGLAIEPEWRPVIARAAAPA